MSFKEDVSRYTNNKRGLEKYMSFFYYGALPALLIYRLLHFIGSKNNLLSKVLYRVLFFVVYVPYKNISGVELHPEADIGGGLYIPHCTNIIISKGAKIGCGVNIHQGTTLGINYQTKKAPNIGDHVKIAPNVTIIGGVSVGDNANILSNSSVTKDVPPSCVFGGVPARFIKEII